MSKLRNTEAVKQLLQGEHKSQRKTLISIPKQKQIIKRNVGDKWEEVDPLGNKTYWEQCEGYRRKYKLDIKKEELDNSNCYEDCEKRETKNYTKYDKKFLALRKMCFDCLIKYEAELKRTGKFEEYAKNIMKENAKSFFKDASEEVEYIKSSYQDMNLVTGADGRTEKWEFEGKDAFLQKIDDDFNKLKENTLKSFE